MNTRLNYEAYRQARIRLTEAMSRGEGMVRISKFHAKLLSWADEVPVVGLKPEDLQSRPRRTRVASSKQSKVR